MPVPTELFSTEVSAVGGPHPDFEFNAARVQQLAGVHDSLLEERSVPCYTFEKVLKMHSAKGCEVLVIDAEGADCAILRSMVGCCRARRCPWPRVIRFETRGSIQVFLLKFGHMQ